MNNPISVAESPRPAFVAEAETQFNAVVQSQPDLEFIDAVIPDLCGALRGKRFPIGEAAHLFSHGMAIPHSIYLMDAHGEMTNAFGRGFSDGDPDGTAWPLPGTLSRVAAEGPPRAQILMSLRDAAGVPDPGEPRAVLERVLERFGDLGLVPVTALELEFYLVDLDRYEAFLSALAAAARKQAVPLSAASKEYAAGQFEANLKHQKDARFAADNATFLKQVVKEAARSVGFDATFMAKPYEERAGNGLHIHLSILDRDCLNIFAGADAAGSEQLRHAIGGMQVLMPESMAIFAP